MSVKFIITMINYKPNLFRFEPYHEFDQPNI